ncbi:MAG: secretin N-terminal domain-containing protein [Pseudomonadota bacterium]
MQNVMMHRARRDVGIIVLLVLIFMASQAIFFPDCILAEENERIAISPSSVVLKWTQENPTSSNNLLTLNFYEVDIRQLLSSLAIKRQANIIMTPEVSGKISVHLYRVPFDEAISSIVKAGGFGYYRYGDVHYVYKPKEEIKPGGEIIQLKLFQLKYGDAKKLQEILEAIEGVRTVKIHEDSKTIVVEDTPENIKKIETVITFWDRMPKQVLIEAKILEVALTDDMSLGVQWEKLLSDVRMATGGLSTATSATEAGISPLPASGGSGVFANMITRAGSTRQFTAALDALLTKTTINTLSTPKLLATHGKPARVQVGGQQGYENSVVNMGVITKSIAFINTGTILEITPYIDDDNNVLLNVQPTINTARVEQGVPVVNTTCVSTWLLAKSGETVFIGGLIQDTKTKTRKMVPCLGSIPGLGPLFGSLVHKTGKSELIVLITPQIVDAYPSPEDRDGMERAKEIEKLLKKDQAMPVKEKIFDVQ